jgi:hypothetical protein
MISVIEKITFVVKILIYREENIEGEILTEKLVKIIIYFYSDFKYIKL